MSIQKLAGVIVMAAAATACSTTQKSTYESVTTNGETKVTATGDAAVVAAGANTSYSCQTCNGQPVPAQRASGAAAGHRNYPPRTQPSVYAQEVQRVQTSAVRAVGAQVSLDMNSVLRDLVGGVFGGD